MVKPMLPPYDVKKFPSYLKGLVNDLARLRGDEVRLQALQAQLDAERARVRVDTEACERLIERYDSRLCTAAVVPVRAWRQRYGQLGALQNALVEELRAAYPSELPTSLLAMSMMARFGLDFATTAQRNQWAHNTLTRGLKRLTAAGRIERLHFDGSVTNLEGRWRWMDPDAPTGSLAGMAEAAAAAGVEVDDEPEAGK